MRYNIYMLPVSPRGNIEHDATATKGILQDPRLFTRFHTSAGPKKVFISQCNIYPSRSG